jgi:hypothetical protein
MADGAAVLDRQVRSTGRVAGLLAESVVDYLGPATVVDATRADVVIELPGGRRTPARLALASPYEPVEGDVLLVIGGPGACYAIGVLEGTGRTVLAVPGDVEVRAVGGSLRLSGDRGVHIEGDSVEVRSSKLQVIAGAVVEKFTTVCQRVSEMLSVRAGQRHTIVDGESLEKSRSATILTEEAMAINGKQIHLG